MTRYTITPWRTQTDLLEVRQQLYSSGVQQTDMQRHAVERIMAWKLRGNLPHAVESTALLVDAVLHHDMDNNSSFSIRAVYGAAFCRFVTGFCDIGRHKERHLEPSSMLEIAKQIDMPAEFVALRHEATHEELPSTHRLVDATQKALAWLWKVYWSRLGRADLAETIDADLSVLKEDVAAILRNYRKSRVEILRAKDGRWEDGEEDAYEMFERLEAVVRTPKSLNFLIVDLFVGGRLIFPADLTYVHVPGGCLGGSCCAN